MKVIDARHIGLEGDHHADRIMSLAWSSNSSGMPAGRSMHRHLHGRALLFGLLDAALDIADGFEVFVELALVALAEAGLQARDIART